MNDSWKEIEKCPYPDTKCEKCRFLIGGECLLRYKKEEREDVDK